MSVPPETIQVKRIKRDREEAELEDGATFNGPDYLRLHTPKRVHSDVFVYQRVTQYSSMTSISDSASPVPTIHPTKPGQEHISATRNSTTIPQPQPNTTHSVHTKPISSSPSAIEPRRFHFARSLLTPTSLLTGLTTGKRSRNTTTTVFVEHKHKRSRTEDVPMLDVAGVPPVAAEEPPRKLKRPGADRKGPPKPVAQINKELPKSMDEKHWAAENDQIARSANDFALQIIGQNLAEEEEREKKAAAAAARKQASSTSHNFKPTPPSQRFAQRHPEMAAKQEALLPPASDQGDYEPVNEDDYVVETYVRVPASALGQDVAPEKIGLLVFGNDSDAEFFYGAEGDSDDEWAEDDEDENAENYYTADYPDEELDSGDEYGRGAYNYRGNASDQEEFDENDYVMEFGDNDNLNDAPILPNARMGLQPPSAFPKR